MLREKDKDGDGAIDFTEFKAIFELAPTLPLDANGSRWAHLASAGATSAAGSFFPSSPGGAPGAMPPPSGKKRKSAAAGGGASSGAETAGPVAGRTPKTPRGGGGDAAAVVFAPLADYGEALSLAPYVRFEGTLWGSAGKPSSADVSQGKLNNCYLAAALGVLADEFPDAIVNAFAPVVPPPPPPPPPRTADVAAAAVQGTDELPERLWEVTFKLPARHSRHSSGGSSLGAMGSEAVRARGTSYWAKAHSEVYRKTHLLGVCESIVGAGLRV